MKRLPLCILLVICFAVTSPALAFAGSSVSVPPAEVFSPSTTAGSGRAPISSIDVGATSATITVDVEGSAESMSLQYSELIGKDGPLGPYAPLLLIGAVGTAGLRFLGLLLKLGAKE